MKSLEFSFQTRRSSLKSLEGSQWDLCIIGGGISGAACARDAALRGLNVLLIEAQDFASGTSSGSSKLIHGGIRYLEHKAFHLVFQAVQERELLKKLYAPFVQDIDFVFPTYKKKYPPKWLLRMGLGLYDSFSFFRKTHKSYSKKQVENHFPYLNSESLDGALLYQDSFTEDYRLVIELIKSAVNAGATCLSRLRLTQTSPGLDFFSLIARDELDEKIYTFKAKRILNCAGPFSDEIKKILDLSPALHLTQGVHFVFPKDKLPIDKAFVLSDPENKRILFAIPWGSVSYLGTTDTDLANPAAAKATSEDLRYVLGVARRCFKLPLDEKDVIQSWAAVRPLIKPQSSETNADISREHKIEENPDGFFHLLGGKLTSHRLMAEEAINLVGKSLGSEYPSVTDETPLQGQPLDAESVDRLTQTYGIYSSDVMELDVHNDLQQKRISRSLPHMLSEILYAIYYEMALEPLDFLRRRSSIYYETSSKEIAEVVARVFQKEMNWNESELEYFLKKTMADYQKDSECLSK